MVLEFYESAGTDDEITYQPSIPVSVDSWLDGGYVFKLGYIHPSVLYRWFWWDGWCLVISSIPWKTQVVSYRVVSFRFVSYRIVPTFLLIYPSI